MRRVLGLGTLLICLSWCVLADSSGWQGTSDSTGANLTRPRFLAEIQIPGNEGTVGVGKTWVDGEVKAWFDDGYNSLTTDELIREKVNELAVEWKVELQPITLGQYQGYLVEKPPTYYPGAYGTGFRNAGVDALGQGWLTNGEFVFAVKYKVFGDGVYTNEHKDVMLAEASAARNEAVGIIMGLQPYRESQAPAVPPPAVPETVVPPPPTTDPIAPPPVTIPESATPQPPTEQEIPWGTLVGVGTGLLVAVALAAALKQRPRAPQQPPVPQPPSSSPKSAPAQPPKVYVLQVSSDRIQISESAPADLTISVWRVDPISKTYQLAQEATIEVTAIPQFPQLSVSRQSTPGRLLCHLSVTGAAPQTKGQLQVEAQAEGATHRCEIQWEIQDAYEWLVEVTSTFTEGS